MDAEILRLIFEQVKPFGNDAEPGKLAERALGEYQKSLAAFDDGLNEFPQAKAITLFRAMTLYNLSETKQAVTDLLIHTQISNYQRAIQQYAADLDRIG